MYSEARKLRLMEEVLKIKNDKLLMEIETFIKKLKQPKLVQKRSARDFAGIWSMEDAALIERAIEEGCEEISSDDWK